MFTERVIKILFVCAFFDGGEEMFMSFFFPFFLSFIPKCPVWFDLNPKMTVDKNNFKSLRVNKCLF